MSPFGAYLLGLFTIFLILLPWYIFSMFYSPVSNGYLDVFCSQALTYNPY